MDPKALPIKLVVADVDGTLTDGGMYITENGDQFKRFHTKDGMGFKLLMSQGIKTGLLSHSAVKKMVETRAEMLGLDFCYVGTEDKKLVLKRWMDELNLTWQEVAFIGDDINDAVVMQACGYTACPADATDSIKRIADVVLSRSGGNACFREWVDDYFLAP